MFDKYCTKNKQIAGKKKNRKLLFVCFFFFLAKVNDCVRVDVKKSYSKTNIYYTAFPSRVNVANQ